MTHSLPSGKESNKTPEGPSASKGPNIPAWLKRPRSIWAVCFLFTGLLYLSQIFSFLSIAPLLFVVMKQGALPGIVLLLISLLVSSYYQPLDAYFLFLCMGSGALVAGTYFRRRKSLPMAIFSGTLAVFLIWAVSNLAVYTSWVSPEMPMIQKGLQEFQTNLTTVYEEMNKLASSSGGGASLKTVEEKQKDQEFFLFWAKALIPGALVALSALFLWVIFLFFRRIFSSWSYASGYKNLTSWQSPEILIWGVVFSLGALIFEGRPIKILALNALLVLGTVYFFQGLAILVHYLHQRGLGPFSRLFGYLMFLLFFKAIALLMVTLGFIDVWADFRKLKQKKEVEPS